MLSADTVVKVGDFGMGWPISAIRRLFTGIWPHETACSLQTQWSKLVTLGWLGTCMRRSTTERRDAASCQSVGWLRSRFVTESSQASLTCGAVGDGHTGRGSLPGSCQ